MSKKRKPNDKSMMDIEKIKYYVLILSMMMDIDKIRTYLVKFRITTHLKS
jgi:hypothetical protein